MIPEHIQKQINESMFMTGGNNDREKAYYELGAKFGYSLAMDELEAAKKEIERLKRISDAQGIT